MQASVEVRGPRRRSAGALLKTTAKQRLWMNANGVHNDLVNSKTERDKTCRCSSLFLAGYSLENEAVEVRDPLFDAAMDLADRGFHVFPLGKGSKVPRKNFTKWELRATRDRFKIAEWWKRWPGSNPGVACKPSVILVVDLDVAKGDRTEDGRQVFWDLIKSLKIPWEPTRQVRTPSGGVHLYYKAPPGAFLGNSVGRLGPGVDTRAIGGYVVGPGSVVNGRRYEVEVAGPIRELPRPLVELLRTPVVEYREVPIRDDISRYAEGAIANELGRLAEAGEGTRNATLNSVAYRLGRLVGAGAIDREWVTDALLAAGMQIGLSERECVATIRSGLSAGELLPNSLPFVHDPGVP